MAFAGSESNNTFIDVKRTAAAVNTIGGGIEDLVKSTSTRHDFLELVRSEQRLSRLARALAAFVTVDMGFGRGAKAVGTLCANILKQDEVVQQRVIGKLCQIQGIPWKGQTGRAGLVMALFGLHPELMVRSGHDTVAGRRLSWYLVVARNSNGDSRGSCGRQLKGSEAGKSNKAAGAKGFFLKLYNACSAEEQDFLFKIALRAGIACEDWIDLGTAGEESSEGAGI